MSTFTSEPGTRLAGRYRLVDQTSAGNGWVMWKAIDETLARPVSVLTFAPGFPRVPQVVTAARAASRLSDPRMAQVFDIEDGAGQAYIVLEWVGGESLTELVADGPLDPSRACTLITDAARAMSGAHGVGQAHLRLTPEVLRWTRSSGIKITGLGIDAALAGDGLTGPATYDPAMADTIALAGLLYAALTGYWPCELPAGLPAAPLSEGGAVCTPRQVTPDVTSALDSLIVRALLQRPTRQGPPISSPSEFADELSSVAPPAPLPEPAPVVPAGYGGYDGYGPDRGEDSWAGSGRALGATAPYQPGDPATGSLAYGGGYQPGGPYPGPARRGGTSRVLLTVVLVLVLVAVAATIWAVGFRKGGGAKAGPGPQVSTSTSASPAGTALKPVSDITFNILGTDNEDASQAPNAIDGSTSTFWGTDTYKSYPNFGALKKGTGLLIDMGKQVQLNQVKVLFGATGQTTAEIYLGNSAAMSKTALQNFTLVGKQATGSGWITYPVTAKATGRYVLIWLTGDLPAVPGQAGLYQGQVYDVAIRGTDVPAS